MVLAGLQKLSLVDYPGFLAAVVFTQGCDFYCPYCQNPDLIDFEKRFDLSGEDVLEFLEKRRNMLDGVVFTGGEPLIHRDLGEFAEKIKHLGLKVKLDTNGSDPDFMEELVKNGLVDYLAVDIKTSPDKYGLVSGREDIKQKIRSAVRFTVSSGIPYEFRTTCVPGIVSGEDFEKIAVLVKGAEKYCLQQFRNQITYAGDFRKTKPFGKEDLAKFSGILSRSVKKVELRGI